MKYELYVKNFNNELISLETSGNYDIESIKRCIFYGIKAISNKDSKFTHQTIEEVKIEFDMLNYISYLIGFLTPEEFQTIFPIKKYYNGYKFGSKDYFFTKEYINSIGEDIIIEDPLMFLINYYNEDITEFTIDLVLCADTLRYEELPSIIEKWTTENGITAMEVSNPILN